MHGYPVARTSAPQDPRSKARANPTCRSCMSFQDHHPGATWSSGKYSRECLNLLCHCEIVRKDLRPIPSLRIYHERIFTSRLSLSRWWLTQTPRSFLFVRDTLGLDAWGRYSGLSASGPQCLPPRVGLYTQPSMPSYWI